MYSRRLLLFIVWKALEYEPAFEQGDAAGSGGVQISVLGVTRGGYGCHQGGLPFSLRGVKFNPFNPLALRSANDIMIG